MIYITTIFKFIKKKAEDFLKKRKEKEIDLENKKTIKENSNSYLNNFADKTCKLMKKHNYNAPLNSKIKSLFIIFMKKTNDKRFSSKNEHFKSLDQYKQFRYKMFFISDYMSSFMSDEFKYDKWDEIMSFCRHSLADWMFLMTVILVAKFRQIDVSIKSNQDIIISSNPKLKHQQHLVIEPNYKLITSHTNESNNKLTANFQLSMHDFNGQISNNLLILLRTKQTKERTFQKTKSLISEYYHQTSTLTIESELFWENNLEIIDHIFEHSLILKN